MRTKKKINLFATRVRQMILQYQDLKDENDDLKLIIDKYKKEIISLQAQLKQSESDYRSLKLAKMIEISDTDKENAQKRISKLIRNINKCITIISEK